MGICGNFDGDVQNDYTTKQGSDVSGTETAGADIVASFDDYVFNKEEGSVVFEYVSLLSFGFLMDFFVTFIKFLDVSFFIFSFLLFRLCFHLFGVSIQTYSKLLSKYFKFITRKLT